MRTLAIVQSKGGAGKTTIALNLMAAAAEAGLSVALIDADYHAAGSTVLVGFTPPEQSLFAVLRDNVHPLAIVQPVGMLSAVVLPGSFALSDLPADLPLNALADCIAAMREGPHDNGNPAPDLVIVDCPGGDVAMARQAVYAADQVVIPLNFSALDTTANEATIHLIASVRQVRPRGPALAGLIPNRIQRGDTVARDLAFLVASRVPLLPAIPESNLIRRTGFDADPGRRLVVSSHPKSRAAERFRLLHHVLGGEQAWSREMGLQDLALQLRSSIQELVPSEVALEANG